MKKIDIDELRKIQLNMLEHIKTLCNAQDIKFFLCGGTLLGAVRHQGYIPWDDDIDIALLREDYEKLLRTLLNDESIYKIYSCETNRQYPYRFAKLYDTRTILHEDADLGGFSENGVYIDIFPIDSVPKNKINQKLYYFFIYIFICIHQLKIISLLSKKRKIYKNIILIISKALLCPVSLNQLARAIDYLAKVHFVSPFCGRIASGYGLKQIVPSSAYSSVVMMKFENAEYPVPVGYHQLLSQVYGDYMQLPPIENRRKHYFKAYWK